MTKVLDESYLLFNAEPFDPLKLTNLTIFKYIVFKINRNLMKYKLNLKDSQWRISHDQAISLKNKFILLKDNETSHSMYQDCNEDSNQSEGPSTTSSSGSNEKA